MKKRIISILLAVVMLASSVDITAFAAEVSAAETEAIGGVSYTETEMQEESGAASDTENLTEENGQEATEEETEDALPEEEPAEMQTPEAEMQTGDVEESSDCVEEEEARESNNITASEGQDAAAQSALETEYEEIQMEMATLTASENTLAGSGTESDPYLICSMEDWNVFKEERGYGARYRLMTDLVMNDNLDEPENVWIPQLFISCLDGNGHKISNLYIKAQELKDGYSEFNDVGLFYENAGTISNLTIENVKIDCSESSEARDVAVFAGNNENGVISNCFLEGTVYAIGNIASISGIAANNGYTISDSTNNAVIGSENADISGKTAGIVRYNRGTVENCSNGENGIVYSAGGGAAGIVGTNSGNGKISSCTNMGTVDCSNNESVIPAGIADQNEGIIENCINSGTVKAAGTSSIAAGICKYNYGELNGCENRGSLEGTAVYGIVYQNSGSLTGCRNIGDLSSDTAAGICGVCSAAGTLTNCSNSGGLSGSHVAGIVYDLEGQIAECFNEGELCADENGNATAAGIVYQSLKQNGSLIENCRNDGSITGFMGAAGIIYDTWYGITIKGCCNYADISADEAAGIAYSVGFGGTIDTVVLEGCENTGNITQESEYSWSLWVAGIVCTMYSGTIRKCRNSGCIRGSSAGGTGGIAGAVGIENSDYGNGIVITECYNEGEIKNDYPNGGSAGGIVYLVSGDYENEISDCYNVGRILVSAHKLDGTYTAGGIFCNIDDGTMLSVSNCYNLDEACPDAVWDNYGRATLSDVRTCTDSEMRTQATYANWDFDAVWAMGGEDYPYPVFQEDIGAVGNESNGIKWSIDSSGTLSISGTGDWERDKYEMPPWHDYVSRIKTAVVELSGTTNLNYMFDGCSKLTACDFSGSDLSSVTSMAYLFYDCSALAELDFGDADTSNVVTMEYMFYGCRSLESIDLSHFTSENLLSMRSMFFGCSSLQTLDLSSFDVSKVTDYYAVFTDCKALVRIQTPRNVQEDTATLPCTMYDLTNEQSVDTLPMGLSESVILVLTEYEGEFQYWQDDGKYTYTYNYDEIWFKEDDTKYQHELARMSLRVALAAFGKNGIAENSNDEDKFGNVKNLMSQLKFKNFSAVYPYPEYNSIGYAIGSKTLPYDEDCSLIMVTIRGGGYGAEWGGNLIVEDEDDPDAPSHAGFQIAADQVLDGLKAYITEHSSNDNDDGLKSNIKIWITGYSRAAATSNLVAAMIDRGALEGLSEVKGLYAYCFECPNSTSDPDAGNGKYDNIFSIVNPLDFVPRVAMNNGLGWKYTKYGEVLYLPGAGYTASYGSKKEAMTAEYEKILSYSSAYDYENLNERVDEGIAQAMSFDDLSLFLANATNNPETYGEKYQTLAADIAADGFGGGDADISADQVILALVSLFMNNPVEIALAILNPITTSELVAVLGYSGYEALTYLAQAHYPQLCLAWMDSMNGDTATEFYTFFRKTIINCPVNVTVYDSGHSVKVKIIDDEVVEEGIDDPLPAYIDVNGQKIIAIPSDEEYTIVLETTDNGEVTYTVEEYDAVTSEAGRIVSYQEIGVETDQKLIGTVENLDALEDSETADYSLSLEGTVLEPDIDISDNEVQRYSVEVESEFGGTVSGGGTYLPGEFAKVCAAPDSSAVTFDGWYLDGELVSKEEEYRFLIENEDIALTAKFQVPDDLWLAGVSENGYDYTGTVIKPEVRVYDHTTLLTAGKDYTISYTRNKNAYPYQENDSGYSASKAPTVTVKGKGNYSGTIVETFAIWPLDISDKKKVTAPDILLAYSGKVQKGKTKATYDLNGKTVTLKSGTDFTYQYPGTDANAAGYSPDAFKAAGTYTVELVGKGNYTGTLEITETITNSTLITKASVAKIASQPYNKGTEITLGDKLKLTYGGKKLNGISKKDYDALGEEGKADYNYTYEYSNNIDIGTAQILITGVNEYAGTRTVTFKITGKALKNAKFHSDLMGSYGWNDGADILPLTEENASAEDTAKAALTYKINNAYEPLKGISRENYDKLEDSETKRQYDYTYEYDGDTKNVGKVKIILTGINAYTGTVTKSYKITGVSLSKTTVTGCKSSYAYTGSPIEPGDLSVTGNDFRVYIAKTKTADEVTLTKGTDYTVSYLNNVKKGTATIVITGINGYTGTLKKKFTIAAYNIGTDAANRIKVDKIENQPYTKGGVKPAVTVTDTLTDKVLVQGTDYTLSYTNNNKVADNDAAKPPTVTITGKGNYAGSRKEAFTIAKGSLDNTSITVSDVVYKENKANIYKPSVTLKDNTTGAKLTAGTDYVKAMTYAYAADTEVKVATKNGNTTEYVNETRKAGETVGDKDIIRKETVITVTVTGKGYYGGTMTAEYRFIAADLSKASVTVAAQAYTGKEVKPDKADITVKSGKTVIAASQYEIVGYENNVNKGTGRLTIRGIGNYGGEKTVKFTITARSMNYTIIYDKNAEDATGTMKNSSTPTGAKLTANAYKRKGYTFAGWNTKADGKEGFPYNNKETFRLKGLLQVFGSKETLYAQWEPVTYKITYKLNGGTKADGNPGTYTIESEAIDLQEPTRTGYEFKGWYTDSKFKESTRVEEIAAGSTGNKTLYAKWVKQ